MVTQLTASDLFTPAPSGVGPFGNVPMVPASGTWLAQMLSIASTVQLPTTSWQPGAPERTILAIESVTFAQSDVNISIMAQGGFLQTAASGSVTFTTTNGTTVTVPVTPDPSNAAQNPTGALGWLDVLTESIYNVYRLAATYATGPLAIANTKPTAIGPYATGAYHVANIINGATYHNQASLTVPSSVIAGSGGTVSGVAPGMSSTIITTAAAHGLTTGDAVYVVIPVSSGVSGLAATFAVVTAVTTTTFQIAVSSSGTYTSGGTVYLCTAANMVADATGTTSNAPPGSVTTAVTQNAAVFVSNIVGWSGSNWESNTALVNRTLLSLAARSPNGPSQAYIYFAETAAQLCASQTPPYTLTNGPVIANASGNPQTGIVTVVVASTTPASIEFDDNVTPGVAQLSISAVTNANPCVLTCIGPTSLSAGQSMTVTISGVTSVSGVNGTFLGTYVSANAFSIPVNTTSGGTYTGGGSVEGGDLGQIDQLIQQNVTPSNTTAITVSALALPISITATVVVPQAYVASYKLAVVTQLQTQLASYALGGNVPDFEVTYDDIVGALTEAGVITLGGASYVRQIQALSLDGQGVGVGVPFPSSQYQALLATPVITVLGV
jgi:hypothetical protein